MGMPPTVAVWINRLGITLELVAFLLAPWQFLDEGAFERLDDATKRYLGGVAMHARVVLIIAIVVTLLLLGLVFALQPIWLGHDWTQGRTIWLFTYVAATPLLALAIARSLKAPLERMLLRSLTRMAEDKPMRLRLLASGAVLLIISTILQLVVTF
jgi:hypothetical protein